MKLLFIKLISLLFIVVLFLIFNYFFILVDTTIDAYIYQIIIIFVLYSLRDFYNAHLQALKEFKGYALIQVISSGSKLILYVIGLIFHFLSLEFLIYAEIGTVAITFIIQQKISAIDYNFSLRPRLAEIKDIFHFSYPLFFDNLLVLINNRINTFIISGYLGLVSVANYDVAGKLTAAASRLYGSFLLVYFPSLSGLIGEEKFQQAKNLVERSMLSISLLILPLIFTTYILRNEIIILLFSSRYLESAFALFLFSISFYFTSLSSIAGYSLVAIGKTFLSFKSNFIGVITGIIVSFILTPKLNIEGAIYSVILARIISSSLMLVNLSNNNLSVNFLKVNIPILFLLPFILLYEFSGITNIYIKLFLIIIFAISELIIFRDFRNILNDIIFSFKKVIVSNIKALGTSKT